MAEQRDNLSASDGSSNSGVPSVRSVDVSERVSALEISLSSIQSNLQRLVGMQTHSVTADNSGINSQFSEVPGPSLGSSVPPFITVSSGIFSSTSQNQGFFFTNAAINALDVNSACSSATPSLVLPKDWLSLSSQLFLTQSSAPGLTISGCLSPVPNYIYREDDFNRFICGFHSTQALQFEFLPPVEPVGVQLQKLVKCDKNPDLQPIRSFQAWGVYSAVMSNVRREKLGDLLSYFLLIAKMSRDTNQLGLGWLDYDRLFRKKAAGNPTVSWGEYDVSLYVGHVVNRRYNGSNGSSVSFPTENRVCFLSNKASCDLPNCKFRHICMPCRGSHPLKFCKLPSKVKGNSRDDVFHKRSRSPSPPPFKTKKQK